MIELATALYDGTSAYKIDEYYDYAKKAQEKQDKRKVQIKKRQAVSFKKFAIILSCIFAVAVSFLYVNAVLIETSTEVNDLTKELEDLKVRNTQVSFDIVSGVDYKEVEKKAINEFGMQHPESYQNVYVDVIQNDYVELSQPSKKSGGVLEDIITDVQAFLAYIK